MDQLQEFARRISTSAANKVYADGSDFDVPHYSEKAPKLAVLEFDFLEHCATIDILAHEYGMGGCRSLTEFSEMIDKEDPLLVEGLLFCIQRRYKMQAGEKVPELDEEVERTVTEFARPAASAKTFKTEWGYDSDIKGFLINSGISPKEVKEAAQKAKSRKISKQEQQEFYNWLYKNVTPEKLKEPDFNLRETYDKLRKYFDKCENFNISAATIFGSK